MKSLIKSIIFLSLLLQTNQPVFAEEQRRSLAEAIHLHFRARFFLLLISIFTFCFLPTAFASKNDGIQKWPLCNQNTPIQITSNEELNSYKPQIKKLFQSYQATYILHKQDLTKYGELESQFHNLSFHRLGIEIFFSYRLEEDNFFLERIKTWEENCHISFYNYGYVKYARAVLYTGLKSVMKEDINIHISLQEVGNIVRQYLSYIPLIYKEYAINSSGSEILGEMRSLKEFTGNDYCESAITTQFNQCMMQFEALLKKNENKFKLESMDLFCKPLLSFENKLYQMNICEGS